MTVDELIEQRAERLDRLAERAELRGGTAARLSEPLAEDAEFLRKLKPSKVRARLASGEEPPDPPRPAPASAKRPTRHDGSGRASSSGGPNPFLVLGVALAAGIFLARWIDWRGHAHPRA